MTVKNFKLKCLFLFGNVCRNLPPFVHNFIVLITFLQKGDLHTYAVC